MKDFISNHKKLLIILGIVLAGALGIAVSAAMLSSDSSETSENASYTVTTGEISSTVTGKGYVEAGKDIKVTAPIGVLVEDVLVKEGETVSAGQELASIQRSSIAGKLAEAQEIDNELTRELNRNDLKSLERESLQGQRENIRTFMSQLRDLHNNPIITAPQNGVITQINLAAGELITRRPDSDSSSSSSSDSASASVGQVSLVTPLASSQTAEVTPVQLDLDKFLDLPIFNPILSALLSNQMHVFSSLGLEVPQLFSNLLDPVYIQTVSNKEGPVTIGTSELDPMIVPVSEGTQNENVEIPSQYDTTFANGRASDEYIEEYYEDIIIEEEEAEEAAESAASNAQEQAQDQSTSSSVIPTQSVSNDFQSYDTTAFEIDSMDDIVVNVKIDERDIMSISPGQTATIKLDALPDEELTGTIRSISGVPETSEGNTKYTVEVQLSTDKNLRSGMTANVTISTGSNQNALIIPITALQEQGSRKFVYTSESSDGTLGGELDVTTGIANDEYVEITSGLSEGTTIYYKPLEVKDLANELLDPNTYDDEDDSSTESE